MTTIKFVCDFVYFAEPPAADVEKRAAQSAVIARRFPIKSELCTALFRRLNITGVAKEKKLDKPPKLMVLDVALGELLNVKEFKTPKAAAANAKLREAIKICFDEMAAKPDLYEAVHHKNTLLMNAEVNGGKSALRLAAKAQQLRAAFHAGL